MSPTRRDILAGVAVPMAAELAPLLRKLPAVDDGYLMSLGAAYDAAIARLPAVSQPHDAAEDAYLALRKTHPELDREIARAKSGLEVAEAAYDGELSRAFPVLMAIEKHDEADEWTKTCFREARTVPKGMAALN